MLIPRVTLELALLQILLIAHADGGQDIGAERQQATALLGFDTAGEPRTRVTLRFSGRRKSKNRVACVLCS